MKETPQRTWLHIWLMPALWLPCAIMSAQFRGDCGVAHHFATFPGGWLPLVLGFRAHAPWIVARLFGALLVVVLGAAVMDILGAGRRVYTWCLVLAALTGVAALHPRFHATDVFSLLCLVIYLVGALAILAELGRRSSDQHPVQHQRGG